MTFFSINFLKMNRIFEAQETTIPANTSLQMMTMSVK